VSLLSDSRVAIEEISRLVGHWGTTVTEVVVYHHPIRSVLQVGAQVMDRLFVSGSADGQSLS
jgi:phosphoketolase